jgi:succinate dehydrogenase / fumarate reductase cytochrome b subunit
VRPWTRQRRLHSITGIVPVGAFLAFHLWANAAAARGPEAYNETARRLQQMPLSVFLEVVLIAIPLAYHAVYGLFVAAIEPRGAPAAGRAGRALAVFQRATGTFLFAFLLFHLWTSRLVQVHDHESLDLFRLMQTLLSNPAIRFFYGAGILAATAHLGAGVVTFADAWGLAPTRRARTIAAVLAAAVFAVLSGLGLRSLSAFRL